jgi:hypothetical protein
MIFQYLLTSLGLGTTMAAESSGRCELAKLVSNHVFRHEKLRELPAIVDKERMSYEVRDDGAIPRPSFDRLAMAGLLLFNLCQQPHIDVGTFFD